LITRLEGHLSAISKVYFSNLGDRILTGSFKDGSVRVWAFNSEFSKSEQIVINLSEDGAGHFSSPLKNNFKKRGRQKSVIKPIKSNLLNACWTCDDLSIITLQSVPNNSTSVKTAHDSEVVSLKGSATKLKVWNSFNGDLLQVLTVSDKEAMLLMPHPFMPTIVVTSGDDGFINMWDIEFNAKYFSFETKAPGNIGGNVKEGEDVKICDVNFSPDGTRLTASDHLGRIFLFGLDTPEKFKKVKPEQYFPSDYDEILLDPEGWAIDVNTQLPVHLVPRGMVTMLSGFMYEDQKKGYSYPLPIDKKEITMRLDELELSNKKLKRTMNQSYATFVRNKTRDRISNSQKLSSMRVYYIYILQNSF